MVEEGEAEDMVASFENDGRYRSCVARKPRAGGGGRNKREKKTMILPFPPYLRENPKSSPPSH